MFVTVTALKYACCRSRTWRCNDAKTLAGYDDDDDHDDDGMGQVSEEEKGQLSGHALIGG